MTSIRVLVLSCLAVASVAHLGCSKPEEITQYEIPKESSASPSGPAGGATQQDLGPAKDRMLAAIVPQGKQAWFFKLSGEKDAVASQGESFLKYIESIRFAGEGEPTPSWKLPEGWKQRSGRSGMRFATIDVPGAGKPLELSVIPLPNDPASQAEMNLSNVNRWRGQMKLPPIDLKALKQQSVEIPLKQATATIVNLEGHLGSGGMGRAPFAGGGPFSGPAKRPQPKPEPGPAKSGITYKAPDTWAAGKTGGMRKAAFQVTDGDKKIEITVIDLAAAAGARLPNVNRWRQQVALGPVTQEQLDKALESIPMGKLKGDYVELVPEGSDKSSESILGVIVDEGEKTWFVKLKGDAKLAEREKERFKDFVKSLRFGE